MKTTIEVLKENTPTDAKRHRLETVSEISELVTDENIDRFINAFKEGLLIVAQMRKAVGDDTIKLEAFTWIDD